MNTLFDPLPLLLAQAENAKPAKDNVAPKEDAAPNEQAGGALEEKKSVVVAGKPDAAPPAGGAGPDLTSMWPLIAAFLVVFYLIVLRPQRTETRKRDDMLKAMKKNDRVLTIGGIIGIVSNISADGKEVTLKIDDNARMHVLRSAIQMILSVDDRGSEAKST